MAAAKPKGFHAGQQDAEPEWQKVLTRPTNQQDAEDDKQDRDGGRRMYSNVFRGSASMFR